MDTHIGPSVVERSRTRSLLRDVARGLGQQMFFWGCDIRHASGNLLVRAGMERIARTESHGEGSSRYRVEWLGGLVELHSYCLGWYGQHPPFHGAIFIRSLERLSSCLGPRPVTPGHYEKDQMKAAGGDELAQAVRPLLEWILAYERQVRTLTGPSYRNTCWRRYVAKVGARSWLPPSDAETWFKSFLNTPEQTQRPRYLLRPSRPHDSPAGFRGKDRPVFS